MIQSIAALGGQAALGVNPGLVLLILLFGSLEFWPFTLYTASLPLPTTNCSTLVVEGWVPDYAIRFASGGTSRVTPRFWSQEVPFRVWDILTINILQPTSALIGLGP